MAIPAAQLRLRSGDTTILFSTGPDTMGKTWEVYHESTGIVVASGRVSRQVMTIGEMNAADAELQNLCESAFAETKAQHDPIGAIGGYSAWDAALTLNGWMQDEDGLHHPICGDVALVPATLVDGVNAILGAVSPPPQWFWAEPGASAGELRVRCVAVPGADSYNVYSGVTLLSNVPTQGWETVSGLTTGAYSVRMAAVETGQVGILSFGVDVEVA